MPPCVVFANFHGGDTPTMSIPSYEAEVTDQELGRNVPSWLCNVYTMAQSQHCHPTLSLDFPRKSSLALPSCPFWRSCPPEDLSHAT